MKNRNFETPLLPLFLSTACYAYDPSCLDGVVSAVVRMIFTSGSEFVPRKVSALGETLWLRRHLTMTELREGFRNTLEAPVGVCVCVCVSVLMHACALCVRLCLRVCVFVRSRNHKIDLPLLASKWVRGCADGE